MTRTQTFCEGCGRDHLKVHRVYKELPYCAACYKRLFVRSLCPGCGNFARLPSFDSRAKCQTCQTSSPCIRCQHSGRPVGKITSYGLVCSSCAHHFREKALCDGCHKHSGKLSRVGEGQERLCPACYSKATKQACQACLRNRSGVHLAADGRRLCRLCDERGEEVPCPVCGVDMPAGRGKDCNRCALKAKMERRIAQGEDRLTIAAMQALFRKYGEWLAAEIDLLKATLIVSSSLAFFVQIEGRWQGIPPYDALLKHFRLEGLKRYSYAMRWLTAQELVEPDLSLREQTKDERLIRTLMETLPSGTPAHTALLRYHAWLQARYARGRTSIRSMRLALSPAVSLLMATDVEGSRLPDQRTLDRFLRQAPGQKAALTGFVLMLNREQKLALELRTDQRLAEETKRRKLEQRVMVLMRSSEEGPKVKKAWLRAALPYFHALNAKVVSQLKADQYEFAEDGSCTVQWQGKAYWLPGRRQGIVEQG